MDTRNSTSWNHWAASVSVWVLRGSLLIAVLLLFWIASLIGTDRAMRNPSQLLGIEIAAGLFAALTVAAMAIRMICLNRVRAAQTARLDREPALAQWTLSKAESDRLADSMLSRGRWRLWYTAGGGALLTLGWYLNAASGRYPRIYQGFPWGPAAWFAGTMAYVAWRFFRVRAARGRTDEVRIGDGAARLGDRCIVWAGPNLTLVRLDHDRKDGFINIEVRDNAEGWRNTNRSMYLNLPVPAGHQDQADRVTADLRRKWNVEG